MTLSVMDEQDVRSFAQNHPELLKIIILPDAYSLHGDDNFIGEAFSIAAFVSLCTNMATILGGAVAIAKVLNSTRDLIVWMNGRRLKRSQRGESSPALREQILILLFDAYVNRKVGIKLESLCRLLGVEAESVTSALEQLKRQNVVRKAKDGSWRYVRSN